MPDQDEFGGVAVAEEQRTPDEFGGVPVDESAFNPSDIKLSPYEQAVLKQGGPPRSELDNTSDMLRAMAESVPGHPLLGVAKAALQIPGAALENVAAATGRTIRDVLNPQTYLPPEMREKPPFVLGRDEIRYQTPEEAEKIQAGVPLISAPYGSSDMRRLISSMSTPGGIALWPLGMTRAGAAAILTTMAPGLLQQVADTVSGGGTDEEKRDRINQLFALGVMHAGPRAGSVPLPPGQDFVKPLGPAPREPLTAAETEFQLLHNSWLPTIKPWRQELLKEEVAKGTGTDNIETNFEDSPGAQDVNRAKRYYELAQQLYGGKPQLPDLTATGRALVQPPGAVRPRVEPPPGVEVATPEEQAAAMRQSARQTAGFEPGRLPKPTVPEVMPTPEDARSLGLDTINKVLDQYPELQGNREAARQIRDLAFPEKKGTGETPKPKPPEEPPAPAAPPATPPPPAPPAAPAAAVPGAIQSVSDFIKRLDDPNVKGFTEPAYQAGLKATTLADLDALAAKREALEAQAEAARKAGNLNEYVRIMSGIIQLPNEAIQAALNIGGAARGTPAAPDVARPLDIATHPEAAEWLRNNWQRLKLNPDAVPDALRVPKPTPPAPAPPAAPTPPPAKPPVAATPTPSPSPVPSSPERPPQNPVRMFLKSGENMNQFIKRATDQELLAAEQAGRAYEQWLREEQAFRKQTKDRTAKDLNPLISDANHFTAAANFERVRRAAEKSATPPVAPAPKPPTATPPTPAPVTKTVEPPVKQTEGFDAKQAKQQKGFLLDHVEQAIEAAPETIEGMSPEGWMNPDLQADSLRAKTATSGYPQRDYKLPLAEHEAAVKAWMEAEEPKYEDLFQKYNIPKTWAGSAKWVDIDGIERQNYPPETYNFTQRVWQLENAINKANNALRPTVTIEVPGDGTFTVPNSKQALKEFQERAGRFPTTSPRAPVKVSQARSTPTGAAPVGDLSTDNVKKAAFRFVSEDKSRAVIQNVWSDGKQTVATDGRHMIVINKGIGGTEKNPLMIDETGKKAEKDVTYPNWKQVVPDEKDLMTVAQVDAARLFTGLKQAQGVLPLKGDKGGSNSVKLYRNPDGSIAVAANNVNVGSYEHNVQPGAKVMAAFNPEYIIDALNAARTVGDEKVTLRMAKHNGELSPIVIESPNTTSVVMPMRLEGPAPTGLTARSLKAQEAKAAKAAAAAQPPTQPAATPKPAKWTSATDETAEPPQSQVVSREHLGNGKERLVLKTRTGQTTYEGTPEALDKIMAQRFKTTGESGFISLAPLQDLFDKVEPAVRRAFGAIRELGQEAGKIRNLTPYRRAILNWSAKLQRSFGEAAAAQKEINKIVPSRIRQDGITNWIQADGDAAVLRQRLAATIAWRDPVTGKPHPVARRLIAGYEASLNLTPEEIQVARDVKAAYDALGRRGQAYDVLRTFKDNYVTQIWNLGKSALGLGGRTLKERFRFSRASTFPTFFDGEQAGYVPKTKAIGQLLPVYLHEMNTVIAARQLVAQMARPNSVASDGRPLLSPRGVGVPINDPITGDRETTLVFPKAAHGNTQDYRVMANQPALQDWRWAATDPESGATTFLKSDLAVHPEAFARLQSVLGRSAIRDWYSTKTSALAEIPKVLVRGLDAANAITKQTMLGLASPFHQVQEGTHAIGHRVNPFFNIPKIDLVGDRGQMDAARHGLMLLPDRASEGQFMEGFKVSGLVSRIPGIGPVADWYSNYLFKEYIPGLKYKTYEAILARNQKVYADALSRGTVSLADVKTLSAEQANAAYGHLNYADLGRNPTIQHLAQTFALAPDFWEARARFLGQSIVGLTGAKVGREQLIALGALALGQAATAYTMAKATGGEWDPKRPFEFTNGPRRYTVRSVPEDVSSLLHNARLYVHSRLSPIIGKGTLQYLSGVDFAGRKVSAGQTTKELAQQPIPISIRGFLGIGKSSLSGLEQLAGAVGLKISRRSVSQDVNDMAREWMRTSGDPKAVHKYELSQQQQFGESDYGPLRKALADNNMEKAAQAYQQLLAEGKKRKTILETMRPFTVVSMPGGFSTRHDKPVAGLSLKEQRKFLSTLTPEQRKIYDADRTEQLRQFRSFQELLRSQPQ